MFCAKPVRWWRLIILMIGIVAVGTVDASNGNAGSFGTDNPFSGSLSPTSRQQLRAGLIRSGNFPRSGSVDFSSTSSPPRDLDEIVLFNPSSNSRDAYYSLNGTHYVMKPGSVQKFKNDRVWKVAVNTGTGTTPYTLSSGIYKFRLTGTNLTMGLFATQEQPEPSSLAATLRGQQRPTTGTSVAVAPTPWAISDYTLSAEKRLAYRNLAMNVKDSPGPMISASQWFNTWKGPSAEQLRGKVILLDFWGSWCGPCVRNLPKLQALYQQYKDRGLVVIGVHSAEGAESVAGFLASHPVSFPIAIDTGATAERYKIESWPSYFLIDKTGHLQRGLGHEPPSAQQIESLLN